MKYILIALLFISIDGKGQMTEIGNGKWGVKWEIDSATDNPVAALLRRIDSLSYILSVHDSALGILARRLDNLEHPPKGWLWDRQNRTTIDLLDSGEIWYETHPIYIPGPLDSIISVHTQKNPPKKPKKKAPVCTPAKQKIVIKADCRDGWNSLNTRYMDDSTYGELGHGMTTPTKKLPKTDTIANKNKKP